MANLVSNIDGVLQIWDDGTVNIVGGKLQIDASDVLLNNNNADFADLSVSTLKFSDASPTLSESGNYLRVQTTDGYIDIGANNTSYAHFYTDRPSFFFGSTIRSGGNQFESHTGDLALSRIGSTTARLRITAGTTVSDQDFSVTGDGAISGNLTVTGNLQVDGTTTTLNTQTITAEDAVILLNSGQTTPSNDIGLVFQRYSTATNSNYNPVFMWEESSDKFVLGTTAEDGADADISLVNQWLVVNSSGNVGINVDTPSQQQYGSDAPKLHVYGSENSGFRLVARFQSGTDANDSGSAILVNHGNDRGILIEGGRGGAGSAADDDSVAHLGLLNSGANLTRMITLKQHTYAGTDNRYSVGIGTTQPEAKLDLYTNGIGAASTVVPDWNSTTSTDAIQTTGTYRDMIITNRHGDSKHDVYGYATTTLDFRGTNTNHEWELGKIMGTVDPHGSTGNAGGLVFFASDGGTTDGAGRINRGTASRPYMSMGNDIIYANAKLGIGVTSPTSPLTVLSDSGASAVRLLGRSADNISGISFANNGNTASMYIQSNSSWIRARADSGIHVRRNNTPTVTDTDAFTIEDMNMTFNGDNSITFGPNSSHSKYLRIGGINANLDANTGGVAVTNGNLHLDASASNNGIYFNWYGGTAGTYWGDGNGIEKAHMDSSGNLQIDGTLDADTEITVGANTAKVKRENSEKEVDILNPDATSGTWTETSSTTNWGDPKFNGAYNSSTYNDGTGYLQFNIPSGMKSAYMSQLTWNTGGYADVQGVQSDGGLVFLRRINTKQSISNVNHGNPAQHDGSTVTFLASGLENFTALRIQNRVGRLHCTGVSFNANKNEGTEGTGMVNWAQIENVPDPTVTLTGAVTGSGTLTNLGNVSIATTATSDPTLTLAGDATGSATFTNLGNATLSVTVGDDSHTHSKLVEGGGTITYGQGSLQWTDVSGAGGTGLNSSTPTNPTSDWYHHIVMNHNNGGGYYVDLAACFHTDAFYMRRLTNGSLTSWNRFFADNYHPNADTWTSSRTATVTLTGDATGTAGVSVNGSANWTNSIAVTVGSIDGQQFVNTRSNSGRAANSTDGNGIYYYTSDVDNFSGNATDGAIYQQSYSTLWYHQIAGDYRSGNIALRGKNNNTWQRWKKVPTIYTSDSAPTTALVNDDFWFDSDEGKLKIRYNGAWMDTFTLGTAGFVNKSGDTMTGSLTISTIVGNNSGTLNVTGDIVASGDVTAYSDITLKSNIQTIDNALDKVTALRGVTFDKDGRKGSGVIAQEVEEVLPEVVHTNDDGLKSVAYGNMVGTLIEAMKEQQEQINQLKAEIEKLKGE